MDEVKSLNPATLNITTDNVLSRSRRGPSRLRQGGSEQENEGNMAKNDGGSRGGGSRDVSPGGFVVRLIAALVLVFATYNPTDYSFYAWVQTALGNGTVGAIHFFVGVVLIIGWTIYGVASYRSLGLLGLVLGAAFFATLVWLLIDFEILTLESATAVTWVVLVCLAGLLAIGVSWSHIWRRLTGQLEVDED